MRDKYWHNMAARIQRAWRRYVKRKEDAAKVIQNAWRMKTHGNQYEQLRDYGNTLLQGRKERRRLSMLGSRAFMGDYLGCNDKSGYGRFVINQAGIKDHVVFSGKGEILLSKFGRSSKRLPRIFILSKTSLYVVAEALVEKRLQLQKEFVIPINSIKSVGLSTNQDNWVAVCLHTPTAMVPDIFINLDLKTEFITHLKKLNPGLSIVIGPTIQYQKKPGKYHTVKSVAGSGPQIPQGVTFINPEQLRLIKDFQRAVRILNDQGVSPEKLTTVSTITEVPELELQVINLDQQVLNQYNHLILNRHRHNNSIKILLQRNLQLVLCMQHLLLQLTQGTNHMMALLCKLQLHRLL